MHIATTLQERMADGLISGALISQYALYSALLCSLNSSISKEQHEKYPCNPSSHNRKYRECTCEIHAPNWKTHKPVHFVIIDQKFLNVLVIIEVFEFLG